MLQLLVMLQWSAGFFLCGAVGVNVTVNVGFAPDVAPDGWNRFHPWIG